jgi:glycine/D-amino acid oxidase-like deaminating enzyme
MLRDPHSHGLWEVTAPPAPVSAPLLGSAEAEVVIVGAGYTGLSAALRLSELDISATVLEAAEVGFGASGRNVGLVNAGMWVMPDVLTETLGRDRGERLLDFLSDGPARVFEIIERHGIDCEAERAGTLHLACDARGLCEIRERARQWQRRGAPVRLLDAAETSAKLGSDAYAGSLLDLRAGTIQPLAYSRGLAAAAVRQGARLYTGTPVDAVERVGGAWRAVTPRGSVTARWVIVGTDAYTGKLFSGIRAEQVGLPYFNFATEPLPMDFRARVLPEREGCWDTKQILSSFRFDRGGRLVFGSVGALRNTGAAVHRAWALREIRRIWPELDGMTLDAGWYGRIGMTADHLPRFHRLDDRIISVCGYNGRGIAPGTIFGRLLADHVAGVATEADIPIPATEPAPVRALPLREAFYELGAQVAHFAGARRH